jgi:hypothetical protein
MVAVPLAAALLCAVLAWFYGKAAGIKHARNGQVQATTRGDGDYLPGDLVRITLPENDPCNNAHNGKGVVIYGPDRKHEPGRERGWLVSSAPGSLRCVASELTMITPREDRES